MAKSLAAREYPNIRHAKEYYVWCLDKVYDDILWEIVQEFGDKGKKYNKEIRGQAYISFQLVTNDGAFSSFSCNKEDPTITLEKAEINLFNKRWGKLPKTGFLIENSSKETSALLAIEFVKKLQKRYANTAFDYSGNLEDIVFDDDIQKANFILNSAPIPKELEDLYNQEQSCIEKGLGSKWKRIIDRVKKQSK